MGSCTLTQGSLAMIREGNPVHSPIMQILNSRRTAKEYNILSDGKHYMSNVVFSTKSKKTVSEGIPKFSILKIKKYAIRVTGKPEKHIFEIIDFQILAKGDEINKRMGFPKRISGSFTDPNVNTNAKPTQKDDIAKPNTKIKVTHTISSLRPELNNWTIKARMVERSDIMSWSKSKKKKNE